MALHFCSALDRSWVTRLRPFVNPAVEQPTNKVVPGQNQHGHQREETSNLVYSQPSETAYSKPAEDERWKC